MFRLPFRTYDIVLTATYYLYTVAYSFNSIILDMESTKKLPVSVTSGGFLISGSVDSNKYFPPDIALSEFCLRISGSHPYNALPT